MAIQSKITVHPVPAPAGSKADFVAELRGADLENLSGMSKYLVCSLSKPALMLMYRT